MLSHLSLSLLIVRPEYKIASLLLLCCVLLTACTSQNPSSPPASSSSSSNTTADASVRGVADDAATQLNRDYQDYPLYGLVTGAQLPVRKRAHPDAQTIGWLRLGSVVRLKPNPSITETCHTGWYAVYPAGFACAGQGMDVQQTEPISDANMDPANRAEMLPYTYYYVKTDMVPQYHRLPTRDEHRLARAWGQRYLQLQEENPERAAKLRAGALRGEDKAPAYVARYLDRGFVVTHVGEGEREERRFVRTLNGGWVLRVDLEDLKKRAPAWFQGFELGVGEHAYALPLPIMLRGSRPLMRRDSESPPKSRVRWRRDPDAEAIARHTIVSTWLRRERVGDRVMHVLEGERYLHDWFISFVEKIDPPFPNVANDEPWVHIDISEQALVLYRGTEPTYLTLVSSGLKGHETPTGMFRIQRKMITSTMSNLGPDASSAAQNDRYRIEDVPWTQYFNGSIALHAAFWHNRFGLRRSHGCINLSPYDAKYIFDRTWPRIPKNWHGVTTHQTEFSATRVYVTP